MSATEAASRPASAERIWEPLRRPTFRALWTAAVVSNVGTWMHDTAATWTMTTLAPSPTMVSLMQTATSFPFFVLALPAGALADVVDRRRLLLATQTWMLVGAAALGTLTLAGELTPGWLLGLTCALGIGSAMGAPAWQATTPELVPSEELPQAVALGGIAVNVARAIGPALVLQGSLAAGALVWGIVATHTTLGTALLVAAGAMTASLAVVARVHLRSGATLDLAPSRHWGEPVVLGSLDLDQGPVLVRVEYRVDPARAAAFVDAMSQLERPRRRDGAIEWGLFQDTADPRRWLETFLVESWVEHLRQHERVTVSDRVLQEQVYALLDDGEPRVSHLVAREPG